MQSVDYTLILVHMHYKIIAVTQLLFLLLLTICSGQMQSLIPNGSITFANGFTFDASRASLDKQLEVSINVLEDTSDLIPHETVLQPVSPHYKLTSSEDFLSLPDPFVITMPLPEGVSPDGLRVAWLVDGQDIVHNYNDPDAPDEWTESPLTYLPETNEVAFTRIRLHEKGQVFVLIQHHPAVTSEPHHK